MLLSIPLMILAGLVFSYSMGSVFSCFQGTVWYSKFHIICTSLMQENLLSEVNISKTGVYFKFNLFSPRHCLIATGTLFSKNHSHTKHFRDTMHFSLIGIIFYILDVPSISPANMFNEKVITSDSKDLCNSVFYTATRLT